MSSRIAQLSLPWRSVLLRQKWAFQHHVVPTRGPTFFRYFHSKSSLAAKYDTDPNVSASLEVRHSVPDNYFMITTSSPSTTKYGDITDQLAELLSKSKVPVRAEKDPAIVILTTPTFATWLENGTFMSKALDTIFNGSKAQNEPNLVISVLLAVVDGLPPRPNRPIRASTQSTEGFAILSCDQELVLPGLWQLDRGHDDSNQCQRQRPTIVFQMRSHPTVEEAVEISVPLANTMFRNGRTSTLLVSRWQKTGASVPFEKILQVEKKSVTLRPASSFPMIPLHLEIPTIPLTPPRQLVSGLGNIVRQVKGAKGEVVSASKELEASVDAYLKTRSLPKQTVAVWALIVPDALMVDMKKQYSLEVDLESILASSAGFDRPGAKLSVGKWLQHGQGVSLHRVLSGGGGWGPKQGLISLDPETSFKSADTRYNLDDEPVEALGNIAKPGSWIQFLTSSNLSLEELPNGSELSISVPSLEIVNSIAMGSIPSIVDDIPQSTSDPSLPRDETAVRPLIEGFDGHFGAQSEVGIFIHAQFGHGEGTSSKVDVPYSSFWWAITVPKERKSIEDELK